MTCFAVDMLDIDMMRHLPVVETFNPITLKLGVDPWPLTSIAAVASAFLHSPDRLTLAHVEINCAFGLDGQPLPRFISDLVLDSPLLSGEWDRCMSTPTVVLEMWSSGPRPLRYTSSSWNLSRQVNSQVSRLLGDLLLIGGASACYSLTVVLLRKGGWIWRNESADCNRTVRYAVQKRIQEPQQPRGRGWQR